MLNPVLGIAVAFAALVMGGGSARAEPPTRENVVAESPSKEADFQVIVLRGATVSRVTGGDDGEISEVTIREDPSPPRAEAQSDTLERQTRRIETGRSYVIIAAERAVPVSVLQFVPNRDHRFGHRRYDRIRGTRPRLRPRGGLSPARSKPVVVRAERAMAIRAAAAGFWPATPALQRRAPSDLR